MPANALLLHLVQCLVQVVPHVLVLVVGLEFMLVAEVVHSAIQNVSTHCLYLHTFVPHRHIQHDMGKGGVGEAILQTAQKKLKASQTSVPHAACGRPSVDKRAQHRRTYPWWH
jgi:hypothetical protein